MGQQVWGGWEATAADRERNMLLSPEKKGVGIKMCFGDFRKVPSSSYGTIQSKRGHPAPSLGQPLHIHSSTRI